MGNLLKLFLVSYLGIFLSSTELALAKNTTIKESSKRIVVLNPGVNSLKMANEVSKKYGVPRGHIYKKAINGFAISLPEQAVSHMKADKRIKYIVKDTPKKIVSTPLGVKRIGAERNATAAINNDGGNVDIDVAVIDSGIDLDHPNLNVYASVNFAKGKSADDGNGHGTHVAGTIAGLDNGAGTVGVAPGARLWAVRVLDNRGSGWTSDIIAGLDYVAAHADEIEVANMSLGGRGSDDGNCGLSNNDPEHTAVCAVVNAGVVLVVAAGNDGADAANYTPASYDEVITVSAIGDTDGQPGGLGPKTSYGDPDDSLAYFSNYGEDVDIAAPGVDIFSTYKGGGTATLSGTSMASPHIAGSVALYIAKYGRANSLNDTIAIKEGLIALADAQSSNNGFTGDKDSFAEPIVNVENIDPLAPAGPAVKVTLSTDKKEYNTALGETVAQITAIVKDEFNNPISGLSFADFSSLLNATALNITFIETATAGNYAASLDITQLVDGNYELKIIADDSIRQISGEASTSFSKSSVQPPAQPTMFVSEIAYRTSGGKSGNKNLLIDISVSNTDDLAEASAAVSIDLYRNGSFVGSGTALTDSTGSVSFQLRNASAGSYTTVVTDVNKFGVIYDSSLNASDPGFIK